MVAATAMAYYFLYYSSTGAFFGYGLPAAAVNLMII